MTILPFFLKQQIKKKKYSINKLNEVKVKKLEMKRSQKTKHPSHHREWGTPPTNYTADCLGRQDLAGCRPPSCTIWFVLGIGVLVIAMPYASGFDYFFIADEVFDLPTFGIGHSLGSIMHLLIGSRYAVQRNGNALMAFNNKHSCSFVLVPMAQSIGPILSQIAPSPTIHRDDTEATRKPYPPILKQVLPLVEQLPPLYMDLVKGREDFTPKPEETRRLLYGRPYSCTGDHTGCMGEPYSLYGRINNFLAAHTGCMGGNHTGPYRFLVWHTHTTLYGTIVVVWMTHTGLYRCAV
ncbi:hypothetical protein UlMin_026812 [Ulmus minor]